MKTIIQLLLLNCCLYSSIVIPENLEIPFKSNSQSNSFQFAYKVERLPSPRNSVGEVPHWDRPSRSLYYIDIHNYNSSLLRYDYDENRVYTATIDGARTLLFLLPIECTKDQFLVGIDRTAVIAKWDGRSPKATVIQPLFELDCGTSNVINDIKTDERGRFFGGTKCVESCDTNDAASGAFYGYENGKCLRTFFDNVFISNGLTWVRKTKKFYYVDSCTYDIKEFDYDPKTGNISNGQQIMSLINNGVKPKYVFDGMTNDRSGNLYVATFGGSKIVKFNPKSKKILIDIELPATQITSVAFGGPNLDILYVTTANKDGKQPEGSGYLYKVTGLGEKGYAGVPLNLYESCKNMRLTTNNKCKALCKK